MCPSRRKHRQTRPRHVRGYCMPQRDHCVPIAVVLRWDAKR